MPLELFHSLSYLLFDDFPAFADVFEAYVFHVLFYHASLTTKTPHPLKGITDYSRADYSLMPKYLAHYLHASCVRRNANAVSNAHGFARYDDS